MKRFFKYWLLFLSPFFVFLLFYFYLDPFKVIWSYDNYYVKGDGGINRDFVSTNMYIKGKDRYHYNSFIIGNSRSLFYKIEDWKKHIAPNSIGYHFSESGGSVKGILRKLQFIDKQNEKIRNAIITVDYDLLSQTDREGRLFLPAPQLTNFSNYFSFHTEHLKAWFDLRFLYYWIYYHLFNEYSPKMAKYIEQGTNYHYYNPITNEELFVTEDSLIKTGKYFSSKTMRLFKNIQKPDSIYPIAINEERKDILIQAKHILDKHQTYYKIVINPLYNEICINPQDYNTLCKIFGKDNVFNFSGINKWTQDYHHYYEPSHYTANVSSEIMDSIYFHHDDTSH